MPGETYKTLTTEKSTINYHEKCVSPKLFAQKGLKDFWRVLSTNQDKNGIEFISMLEAKNHPIWGTQFHPEKTAYEWSRAYKELPHTPEIIKANG